MLKLFTPLVFLVCFLFFLVNSIAAQQLPAPLDASGELSPLGHAACIIRETINCTDKTVTLQAFLRNNIGGGETPLVVDWSTGENAHFIVVHPPGTYSYVDAPFNCDHHENFTSIAAFFEGNLEITGPPAFCLGAVSVDLTVNTGGYIFNEFMWTPNISDDLTPVTVNGPGTYSIQVTDELGCPTNASITIPPSPPILPILSGPNVLCTENDTGFISINPPFASYQWEDGQTTNPAVVYGPGYFEVTVTNMFGCTGTGVTGIQSGDVQDLAILTNNDELCPGESTQLTLNGAFIGYNWSNGISGLSNTVNAPGTYTVTVTNIHGCTGTASIPIFAKPVPQINVETPAACSGENATLSVSGGSFMNYHWSTGDTTQTITVNSPGAYAVTVTGDTICPAVDTSILAFSAPPNAIIEAPPLLDCTNNLVVLDATNSDGGTPVGINWTTIGGNIIGGQGTLMLSVNTPGEYILELYDSVTTCFAYDTATVISNQVPPPVDAGPDGLVNCTITNINIGPASNPADSTLVYAWSTPDGNIVSGQSSWTAVVNAPGIYIIEVTDITNNCLSYDTVMVAQDIAPPTPLIAAPDSITCMVNSVVLDGSGSMGNNLLFSWSTLDGNILSGSGTSMATVSQEGTYALLVTDQSNGCTASTSVEVVQDADIPLANAALPDTLNCLTTQIDLDGAGSTTGNAISYSWTTVNGNIVAGATTLFPTVNQPGNYLLTVVNNSNNCTASFNVSVPQDIQDPMANAGTAQTLNCTSPTLQLDGSTSSAGPSITYQWTTPDGNIVTGATTIMPTVDQVGTYVLLVTNTNNGCTSTAATTVQEDAAAPVVNIAPPAQLDCITTSITVDGSSSSQGSPFQLAWSDPQGGIVSGATSLQPTVNLPGTYTLVITNTQNGCVDSLEVQVAQDITPPDPDAGPDDLINCYEPSIAIGSANNPSGANFTLLWTTIDGNIVSGAGTSTPMVDLAGTYTLLITNSDNGCTATDEATVTDDFLQPTADAGPGFQLDCQQTSYVLQAVAGQGTNLVFEWTTPNGNIVSGATSLNPEVNAAGDYQLLVTNQDNGCTNTATVAITQSADVPIAAAGMPQTLTCTNTQLQLNGQGSSTGAGISYNWTTLNGTIVSGNTTINPVISAPGAYTLEVFDSTNNCSAFSNVLIGQNIENPVIDAGPDNTLTCTVLDTQLQANVISSSSNMLQYSWSTPDGTILSGAGTSTPVIGSAGNYVLLVTDLSNGCTATDQLTVVNDVATPTAQIVPAPTLTCILTSIPLDGTASSTGPEFTFLWSSHDGNFAGPPNTLQPTIDAPGTYELLITNTTNGCTETASVVVPEDVMLPVAEAGPALVLTCADPSLGLDASGTSTGPEFQYLWTTTDGQIDNGSTGLMPTVSLPGTYALLVTNTANGCTATDEVQTTSDMQLPVLSSANPDEITCIQNNVTLQATAINAGNNPQYQWSTPDGNIVSGQSTLNPNVNSAGVYTLLVENTANGCTSSIMVTVQEDIIPPSVNISNPDLLTCSVTQLTLTANPSAGTSLQWSTPDGNIVSGGTLANPVINAPGTYALLVTDNANGCTNAGSIQVLEEQNIPTGFDFVLTPPTCLGEPGMVIIGSVQGGIGPYMYSVDAGQHFQSLASFENLKPGNYTLVIQDINGCEVEASLDVPEPPEPGVGLPPLFTIQLGESLLLEPILPAGFPIGSIDSVVWSPTTNLTFSGSSVQAQLNPTANPLEYTKYTLTLYTADGCSATASTQIWIKTNLDIYAPTAIKPNDPEHPENAYFTLYTSELGIDKINTLQIYDRWGTQIWEKQNFQPNNPTDGWDGTYQRDALNPGVFVWWAEVMLINGRKILLEGGVTILR
ncbi:MAG: gliding motility-associated C-terminal domain-containing protein [Lewinellaceae bacterium]|nr:gliding motility-associated C-terminal domain-containing protein [Lewinellaceae bacterium]